MAAHAREYYNDEEEYDEDPRAAWTDPNLTEPKLQDELNRRLDEGRRRCKRPRAARRCWKSAPQQPEQQQQQLQQIRYFKYIPYVGMSEPEKKKYLSLGTARLTSSRTEPNRSGPAGRTGTSAKDEASFWPSASKTRSLKVYDYHLAELSLAYRSPPSLLSQPRRVATATATSATADASSQPSRRSLAPKSLFYQLHSSRAVPASAPTATHQQLLTMQMVDERTQTRNEETGVSRGCTPFVDSAQSDYPTEPMDVISKSESNRLLNVVSVDECHVRHRRRRRRLRKVERGRTEAEAEAEAEAEGSAEEGDVGDEAEGVWDEGEEEEEQEGHVGVEEPQLGQSLSPVPAPPDHQPPARASQGDLSAMLSSTRPTTERKKKRTEKEMRQLASAKFLRRNQILREKMAIYLDWKLNEERLGRVDTDRLTDLREGDAPSRFERFTYDLVHQEAIVANQFRGGGGGGAKTTNQMEQGDLTDSLEQMDNDASMSRQRVAAAADKSKGRLKELSLTEMYEALNA